MPYVDGFVLPVPKKKVEAYKRMARKADKVWREHGALEFKECIADDVPMGKLTSFPRSVKRKPNETVVFSYIVYKSRAHRDRVMAKVMKDKRIANMMDIKDMPIRRQAHDLRRLQGARRRLSVEQRLGEAQRPRLAMATRWPAKGRDMVRSESHASRGIVHRETAVAPFGESLCNGRKGANIAPLI